MNCFFNYLYFKYENLEGLLSSIIGNSKKITFVVKIVGQSISIAEK